MYLYKYTYLCTYKTYLYIYIYIYTYIDICRFHLTHQASLKQVHAPPMCWRCGVCTPSQFRWFGHFVGRLIHQANLQYRYCRCVRQLPATAWLERCAHTWCACSLVCWHVKGAPSAWYCVEHNTPTPCLISVMHWHVKGAPLLHPSDALTCQMHRLHIAAFCLYAICTTNCARGHLAHTAGDRRIQRITACPTLSSFPLRPDDDWVDDRLPQADVTCFCCLILQLTQHYQCLQRSISSLCCCVVCCSYCWVASFDNNLLLQGNHWSWRMHAIGTK